MKIKFKNSLFVIGLALIGKQVFAQSMNTSADSVICGTDAPGIQWENWFNQKVEEYKQNLATGKVQQNNYTIPIVVHIIHGGQAVGTYPNLSQAQVNSQFTVLNHDYAGTGVHANSVPAVFSGLVANTGIQFCPVTIDPQGNPLPEPGIDRVNYNVKGFADPASMPTKAALMAFMDSVAMPATIWDVNKYLNVWVTDKHAGITLLGHSTFPIGTPLPGFSPTGTALKDGIWCSGYSFGSQGSWPLYVNYNYGRTLTHEIGHWLGVMHVWGDSICRTDYCNDTPPAAAANSGSPSHPLHMGLCPGDTSGEMFMNFMDYSNDYNKYMFTPDQVARMQTTMLTGTYRTQMGTHGVCNAVGIENRRSDFSVSIFPVPCRDNLFIEPKFSSGKNLNISLISLLGQILDQQVIKNSQGDVIRLDIRPYEKGIYLLEINDGTSSLVRKICIE